MHKYIRRILHLPLTRLKSHSVNHASYCLCDERAYQPYSCKFFVEEQLRRRRKRTDPSLPFSQTMLIRAK